RIVIAPRQETTNARAFWLERAGGDIDGRVVEGRPYFGVVRGRRALFRLPLHEAGDRRRLCPHFVVQFAVELNGGGDIGDRKCGDGWCGRAAGPTVIPRRACRRYTPRARQRSTDVGTCCN